MLECTLAYLRDPWVEHAHKQIGGPGSPQGVSMKYPRVSARPETLIILPVSLFLIHQYDLPVSCSEFSRVHVSPDSHSPVLRREKRLPDSSVCPAVTMIFLTCQSYQITQCHHLLETFHSQWDHREAPRAPHGLLLHQCPCCRHHSYPGIFSFSVCFLPYRFFPTTI